MVYFYLLFVYRKHYTTLTRLLPILQDVSTKIITFTSQGPWAVCILSANGAISNATLRHAGVSGGAVTYEVTLPSSFCFHKHFVQNAAF